MADILAFPAQASLRIVGAKAERLREAVATREVGRLRCELELWRSAVDNLDRCIRSDPALASLAVECDKIRDLISVTAGKLDTLP
ncbi:hypothetical protein [Bradyrhizobium sp. SZCCHNR1093]|uniref:hypothetical protein n=1 Tax=Bradyrhizobium sp. SZCCHNR1093 TaxID=3057368 RepID=UPI0028E61B41|nr:hypothetical protein [Bradyrhizobium sp. SZCCHNR1093]